MPNASRAGLLCAVLFVCPTQAKDKPAIDVHVSPLVLFEPAYVTVRVRIESDADNRLLQVIAESPDFRRSSEITLDGERAPRVNTFQFQSLPAGVYDVTGVLISQKGTRTSFSKTLVVAANPAGRRSR